MESGRNLIITLPLLCYELLYALRPFGVSDVRVTSRCGEWHQGHDNRASRYRIKRVWLADLL